MTEVSLDCDGRHCKGQATLSLRYGAPAKRSRKQAIETRDAEDNSL
jgi:hypothetical protein